MEHDALNDAVIAALDRLEPEKGRQALVVFSDGVDRYSQATSGQVIARARRSQALVYPITIGRRRARGGRIGDTHRRPIVSLTRSEGARTNVDNDREGAAVSVPDRYSAERAAQSRVARVAVHSRDAEKPGERRACARERWVRRE